MPQLIPMTAKSQAAPADAIHASRVEHMPPRLRPYLQLMRLDRPIGTWLLFWPCVFGLVLGAAADERRFLDWKDFYYVILFGIGALVMRAPAAPSTTSSTATSTPRWRAPAAGRSPPAR